MSEDVRLFMCAIIIIPLFLWVIYRMFFDILYSIFGDYFLKFTHKCDECNSRTFETQEKTQENIDYGFFDNAYRNERKYFDIVCKNCGHIIESTKKKRP